MESETANPQEKGPYQDFVENNTKEYEEKIIKNSEKAKIISQGPATRLNRI
jgi:hypothetical protein